MRVSDFLQKKTFFIAGATGFLGQPLVEKILFSAPTVEKIYVLIRAKSQFGGRVVTPQQRLEKELYESSVFDRLRGIHGAGFSQFLSMKLQAVGGDVSKEDFGIDEDVKERLRQEIDVLINSAAMVSFDAPIDQALELNVLAARRMVEFARTCRKAILIHISTAYVSGATHKETPETIFHSASSACSEMFPPGKFRDVEDDITRIKSIITQTLEEAYSADRDLTLKRVLVRDSRRSFKKGVRSLRAKMERLRNRWLQDRLIEVGMEWSRQRGWNDTYTYTKAMGEQVVIRARGELPTVILRPSVIESSLFEPCPGWLDGLRMADPLIVAIGKGRLRALPLDPQVALDLVPADIVVNACLAALAEVGVQRGLRVYQVATGSKNPITLGELYRLIFAYFKKHPMLDKYGQPVRIRPLRFPKSSTFRFRHTLKQVPLDTAARTLERLPYFESTQRIRRRVSAASVAHQKLFYYGRIYEPYLNLTCQFKVDNTMALFHSLSEEDQRNFNFDVTRINWRHYIQNVHIPGVKKYILKIEGAGTMELEAEKTDFPVSTIPELVEFASQRFGKKTALQIERGDKLVRYSFEDLKDQMVQIGRRLGRLGLEKGDRVILFSENQPEWGAAFLGAVCRGLVVVPVDPLAWHREVWSLAEFTESRAILASPGCLARLPEAGLAINELAANPKLLLDVNRFCEPFKLEKYPRSSFFNSVELPDSDLPAPVEMKAEDPVSIIFTTGAVVDPRGAVHSHKNFLNNLYGVNSHLAIRPTDQLLSVLPLYHALEFTCGFLMAIYGGATVTYTQTFKPRLILQTMRKTGTTCLLAVPTFFALLRDDIERRVLKSTKSPLKSNLLVRSKQLSRSLNRGFGKNVGRHLFARVHEEFGGKIRLLVSGGSALGEDLFEDFKAMGMPVYEGYGLTETAPVLTVSPYNLPRAKSAGKPLPGVEIRLDHPDENGVGEIVVRSPSLMLGYYKNPKATRQVVEDNWFRTGDLGWVDIDGFLYITGRTKNVIVTGAGKNVYVEDLEAIYSAIDGIASIAVTGVKRGLTEEVHAVIEPEERSEPEIDRRAMEAKIRTAVRELSKELPGYQRLQQIHFWPEGIPRREDGSIDTRHLREKLAAPASDDESGTTPRSRSHDEEVLVDELSRISSLPAERISEQTDLYADLGLDSLQAIEVLLFLEHEFNTSIPDQRAVNLHTVADILGELRRESTPGKTGGPSSPDVRSEQAASVLAYQERPWSDRLLLRATASFIQALFRTYFRLSVENAERVPRSSSYIIAANHTSHLDSGAVIAALGSTLGRRQVLRLHVLGARDYFFKSRLKGWLVSRTLNVVPIERRENSLSSLRLVKQMLDRGEGVLIFPEGTRSRSGELQEFKAGLGLMALETETPVVPAYIKGTSKALPVGRIFPWPHAVKVVFGSPLDMASYREDTTDHRDSAYRRITTDVRDVIVGLSGRTQGGEKG